MLLLILSGIYPVLQCFDSYLYIMSILVASEARNLREGTL